MVIKTCPVDADGYFNFGMTNGWHGAMAERAKIVIVEIDPAMPYLHGIDQGLHVSQVDYVIDGAGLPLPELPNWPPPGLTLTADGYHCVHGTHPRPQQTQRSGD